ncbi:CMP-sialic acid transporter [Holothuria leucospilota]|uniref:CMP-sialic acid transporter n=1 Tax=Holothuria leucospilota TaxID=206669 RepID=A0A9Q1H6M9_HOLLE|nr:CMP-sialic acid transporter [Holothuria leucospilota]
MTMAADGVSNGFKIYILCVLTFNATGYILLVRYSKSREGPKYLSTTTVLLSELSKLCISVCVLTVQKGLVGMAQDVYKNVICNPRDSLKMAVPSVIYAIQNNLAFYALTYVDAATYQVTYQLKIITTAMFMVIMLGKKLNRTQWLAIVLLFCGVALVQLDALEAKEEDKEKSFSVRGLVAIIMSCMCSGFAGVYFEKILKGSETTLWIRNIQLYLFGLVSAGSGVILSDFSTIQEKGFFYGYNIYIFVIIAMASVGGLYTSIVVKYLDNIIKGFSTAISIILAALVSLYLFNKHFGVLFIIGTGLVVSAVYLYSLPKKPEPTIVNGTMMRPKEVV